MAILLRLSLSPRLLVSLSSVRFGRHRRHDPDFELAFHFARVADFHRVEPKFLEWSFEANLVGGEVYFVGFERGDDIGSADTAVQVAVLRGVGLDGDALLGQFGRLLA